MFHRLKKHTISITHALEGVAVAVKTQPNFRVHLVVALLVVISGIYLQLNPTEWAVITLTIVWVVLTEMLNTAIESMVDLITVEYRLQAKIAKDVAAGAVLLGAIGSIIIGIIIFLPKII